MPLKAPKSRKTVQLSAEDVAPGHKYDILELQEAEIEQEHHEKADVAPEFSDFIIRLEESMSDTSISGKLAKWIADNTYLGQDKFSYVDHEFQRDIANDLHPDSVVVKCSQVGLSELSVRISLALMALKGLTVIYTLPSAAFAGTFSKSRIHPVIEGSPKLLSMLKPGAMSVAMIQLINSFLHVRGAATMTQAISIPADVLLHDEYDFSNQSVMTAFSSRLRHAKNGGIKKKFSTPTVDGFGVTALYEDKSDKKRFLCKCIKCNTWQAPDFQRQLVIPGFDRAFKEFIKDDLHNAKIKVADGYLACVKCKADLWPSLIDPSRRQWVAELQARTMMSGWAVRPFDVPKFNTIPNILNQFGEYDRRQDFHNFVLGETHASHENQVDPQVVSSNTNIPWVQTGAGFCMGVDVGKHFVYVVVGKKVLGEYKVCALFRLKETDTTFNHQLKMLFTRYGVYRAVIDSEPDFTMCKQFREDCGEVYPAVYVRNKLGKIKQYWAHDEKQGTVLIQRTREMDSLVESINNAHFSWPICEEMTDVKEHLVQMKRVEEKDDEDNIVAKWVKVTETDHYFHATGYFKTACDMEDSDNEAEAIPAPTSIGRINLGSGAIPIESNIFGSQEQLSRLRALAKQFGVR